MHDILRKHWTSFLGVIMVLAAAIYLFKYTVDQGWITDEVKIGVGLLLGAGFILGGAALHRKFKLAVIGEIVTGMGFALLYATFSFAGIYYALWDPMTVFICMLVVTIGLSLYSYRFDFRINMNVGLIGGLLSPLMLRPETDQVFTLFIYLLVINAVFFYVSIRKNWLELRLLAFLGTWLMYVVYYFHFDPRVESLWSMPFRYAVAAYLFFVFALAVASWKDRMRFDGLHLYLGIVNAIMFGLWCVTLVEGIVSYSLPMAVMGLIYLLLGAVIYRLTGKLDYTVMIQLIGGAGLMLIAASHLGKGLEMKPLINVYFWAAVSAMLLAAGLYKKMDLLKAVSIAVWFVTGAYWYTVTWSTPRGEWFGVYIPFLNWGALSWTVLAVLGFVFSLKVSFDSAAREINRFFSAMWALLAHFIAGGLLTVQVENMFEEYNLHRSIDLGLTLSISWGIYALILIVWGAYSRQIVFKIFGSVVLVLVAAKTLLLDLAGESTIYKVIVLLVLGAISFTVTWVNSKWSRNKGGEGSVESRMESTK
jgi:uncharacterized membrane protein